MSVSISIGELESILDILKTKLNELGLEKIDIQVDSYKLIGTDEWDDFSTEVEPEVGSLVDDWDSLKLLLVDKERVMSSVDLDRVASVLRAISEKLTA